MAIKWGPAVNTSTNGMRVGVSLEVSGSGASRTITWEIWLWTKRAAFGSSASFALESGVASGSFSFSHSNNSSDWPTSNQTRAARGSFTRALEYGSTQTVSVVGRISGVSAVPGTASVSHSVSLPARGLNAPTPPTAPLVVPQPGYTKARLSWSNNSSSSAPYQSIHVERRHLRDDGTFTDWARRANLSGSATAFTDTVSGNNHYHYRVRANNTGGNSAWLDMGRLNTTPPTPTSVRAARTSTDGIRVTWVHGSRIPTSQLRTRIQRSSAGGAWTTVATLTGAPTAWTDADPSTTVSHRYRVQLEATEWGSATGAWSAASNTVQLAAPPSAPTGLGPAGGFDATAPHTFVWTHVPTDGSDQQRFEIRYQVAGDTTWTTLPAVSSDVSSWTAPAGTFENGQELLWQVRTWGIHPTASPWSASAPAQTADRPTVTILLPTPGQVVDRSAVGVRWEFSQAQDYGQTGWKVALRKDGDTVQTFQGSHSGVNAQTIRGLQNATTYTIAVSVRGPFGMWSDEETVTFTTAFQPPPTPSITATWDVELGAAVIDIHVEAWSTGTAEPEYVQLWRAIGDGDWLLIADEVPLDTAITDPIPAVGDGTINYYRATTVSALPSTADSTVVPLAVSTRATRGWLYLNGGPGMSTVCRVRDNAKRGDTEGKERVLRQYAGRTAPVPYTGTAAVLEWDVSAKIAPAHAGASSRDELVTLQVEYGDQVCYRDPLGARWFGSMSRPAFSWERDQGEVSWSMTRVHYDEGLLQGGDT